MKEELDIEGCWRIRGPDSPLERGILKADGDNIELNVTELKNLTENELFHELSLDPDVNRIIYGVDSHDQPITLFGCTCVGKAPTLKQTTYVIRSIAGVKGAHISNWNQPVGRAICIELQLLHRWFQDSILTTTKSEDGRFALRIPAIDDLQFKVAEGVSVRIHRGTLPSRSLDEYVFRPTSQVWLLFDKPQSLEEITRKWVTWIRDLFSLLFGTPLRCLEIGYTNVDPFSSDTTELVNLRRIFYRDNQHERIRNADPHPMLMTVPYPTIENRLESVFEKWYHVSDQYRAALDLFTSVAFHLHLYADAQFLFLTQSLEIFHTSSAFESKQVSKAIHRDRVKKITDASPDELREWATKVLSAANYKPLNEKLLDLFRSNEMEAKALFVDIDVAARRIARTRNHLTHHTNDADTYGEKEIIQIACAIEAFLWILFLKELGIEGESVIRLLNGYRGSKLVDVAQC